MTTTTALTPQAVIDRLGLEPLPHEGGFFKKVYTSAPINNQRAAGTSIYYLVTQQNFSKWHALDCDEIYHFYQGAPLVLWLYDKNGLSSVELGKDLNFQYTVPAGTWQASLPHPSGEYSLVGTNCFPGYQQEGFSMPDSSQIAAWLAAHPNEKNIIKKMAGHDFA